MADPAVTAEARALHEAALVCDFTLPFTGIGDPRKKAETLPRFAAGGVNCVSITLGGDTGAIGDTVRRIAAERAFFLRNADTYALVNTAADIRRAHADGRLAIVIHFQGTDPVEGDLNLVQTYYDLGVRHMLLAYNQRNRVGDGCFEPNDAGLSAFGRKLVAEMNRVGMLIDCSHTGHRTSMEAIELSTQPVIFSHANPAGCYPHVRNVQDDQIRACAASGGVIGVLGVANMLGPDNDASAGLLARHIDYCVNLVGIDHVGISLDYVFDPEATFAFALANAGGSFPKNSNYSADMALVQPEQYPAITQSLLDLGYRADDVRKVLGENWLRVAEAVWK